MKRKYRVFETVLYTSMMDNCGPLRLYRALAHSLHRHPFSAYLDRPDDCTASVMHAAASTVSGKFGTKCLVITGLVIHKKLPLPLWTTLLLH